MCLNMIYVQLLDEQTQKDFLSILFNSGSDFCHLRFESFSQNVKKKCCWKILSLAISRLLSRVDPSCEKFLGNSIS